MENGKKRLLILPVVMAALLSLSMLPVSMVAADSVVGTQPPKTFHPVCSREISRKVRDFLDRDVFTLLPATMKPQDLPSTCQLNPKFDLYYSQEKAKTEIHRADWQCGFCGKHFKSEFYMDRHMHNKHADKLSVRNN